MKRPPKYIALPVALLIYFVAMTVYGIIHNGNRLPDDFWTILAVELLVLVLLFFVLKKKHDRK